jgi:hypothetical protein
MTDMEEEAGGETVFSEAWPPELDESERKELPEAIQELRASGAAAAAGIEEDSWEEEMVARCRSKLAVRPTHGRAVLFYSQHPNGIPDGMAKHGGCPVLKGPKWAANLWVWNTPRVSVSCCCSFFFVGVCSDKILLETIVRSYFARVNTWLSHYFYVRVLVSSV